MFPFSLHLGKGVHYEEDHWTPAALCCAEVESDEESFSAHSGASRTEEVGQVIPKSGSCPLGCISAVEMEAQMYLWWTRQLMVASALAA